MSRRWILASTLLLIGLAGNPVSGLRDAVAAPPNPAAVYVWRPDLGGWLDTQRNLIWGFSLTACRGGIFTWAGAKSSATQYSSQLATEADARYDKAVRYVATGDQHYAAGNYARADLYYDAAEILFEEVDLFDEASDIASQYSNWRIPTKTEGLEAVSKGLFTYNSPGFPGWDASPAVGLQSGAYTTALTWTSTTSGKLVYVFKPADGTGMNTSQTSMLQCVVVRTHTP